MNRLLTTGVIVAILFSSNAWSEESQSGGQQKTESKDKKRGSVCVESSEEQRGGLAGGDISPNISVGSYVTTQLIRYNLSTKKAALNAPGLGTGIAFRYYPDSELAKISDARGDIRRIKQECRATTLSTDGKSKPMVSPLFSIAPTMFIAKSEDSPDLILQPAIVAGFLRDLVSVGVGYNLTGPGRHQMFILFGVGVGFQW